MKIEWDGSVLDVLYFIDDQNQIRVSEVFDELDEDITDRFDEMDLDLMAELIEGDVRYDEELTRKFWSSEYL